MLLCSSCLRQSARALGQHQANLSRQVRHFQHGAFLWAAQKGVPDRTSPTRKFGKQRMSEHKTKTESIKKAQTRFGNTHLNDPLRLANHTLKLLKQGRREDALRHVQDFGKHQQVTVSWNHLINHDIQDGKVGNAFRSFNEMKKRGQKPDGYTYTVLLRGLAKYAHYQQSLPRAIALYDSMFAETAAVKPSTIHTNAVLQVCALAQDLDAVFSVTARLPRYGPGSPDHMTYTTIFNCLRSTAWANGTHLRSVDQETKVRQRQLAVLQGRKIWLDVLEKWDKGMSMDEKTVCALGRLLLLGDTEKDYDDILSLVQQTMALPREVARIGDIDRPTHLRSLIVSGPHTGKSAKDYDTPEAAMSEGDALFDKAVPSRSAEDTIQPQISAGVRAEGGEDPLAFDSELTYPAAVGEPDTAALVESVGSEFATPVPFQGTRVYAKPGRNTLSLLIDACMRMNAVQPAHKYWAKLTAQFKPDLENYHAYLRLLRMSRSSTAVLELLKELEAREDEGGLPVRAEPKTYTIALSSCVRDGNNPATLDTATEIMKMMERNIEDPHLRAAEIYGSIVSKNGAAWSLQQMREATDVLEAVWKNARTVAAYGSWSADTKSTRRNDFEDEDQLEKDFDPDFFDTVVNTKGEQAGKNVVNPRYRYSLFGITKILRAQIQRVRSRFGMEMNQAEHRAWEDRYYLVKDVLRRMGVQNKDALERRRELNNKHPVVYTGDADMSNEAIEAFGRSDRGHLQRPTSRRQRVRDDLKDLAERTDHSNETRVHKNINY